MSPATQMVVLAFAGVLSGGVNAVAGGGSLLSYPALLALGYPPVQANVTNNVALLPGYAASVLGGRSQLRGQGPQLRVLGAVGLLGALLGAWLLLTTPAEAFQAVVPFLILLACLLLVLQPRLARLVQRDPALSPSRAHHALLLVGVLLGCMYGSYFGAGLGVMLLGILGVFLADGLHRINALKNVLSVVVAVVAVVVFGLFGPVAWPAAAVLAAGSAAGGYLGGRLAPRTRAGPLRFVVISYGVIVAIVLLVGS